MFVFNALTGEMEWKPRSMCFVDGDGGEGGDGGGSDGGDGGTAAAAADAGKGGGDGGKATDTTLGDGGKAPAGNWPETWRDLMSGGDEKAAKRLARFAEPTEVFKSYTELEGQFKEASKNARTPFPSDGDEKAQAAWRKQNGIPEAAAGYFEGLPEGVTIPDADKPRMEAYAAKMHAANASPAQVHAGMAAYYEAIQQATSEREQADAQAKALCSQTLGGKYGGEFVRHMNDLNTWLDGMGVKETLLEARGADGVRLASNPEFLSSMISVMRELNPLELVVPGQGGNAAAALEDEIGKIETTMRTNMRAYEQDKGMQARYLELLRARDANRSRAA